MLEILGHVLNVVLPVFLCIATGYALARLGVPFDRRGIGKLVETVGYPTLIIAHLSAGHVALGIFLQMALAALTLLAVFAAASAAFLKLLRLPLRAFISPMVLNNVGNIGLSVALLAFGPAGLSYSFAFLLVILLGIFTFGTWIPKGEVSFRQIVTSPVIYAILVAVALLATGTRLPKPLADTFGILGGMAIPLMLLTLGHTLATLTITSLRRGTLLAAFHLVMALAAGFGLARLFGFEGTEKGVFVLMALMPVSVATYLFVELHTPDRAPDVASLIMVSTIMTVAVLPLVMTYGL